MTPIPLTISDNIVDYKYLLHTIHTNDEDNKLFKIIKRDIIDTDTDCAIIVGYRQHILPNYKLDHSDTDNDIPYHIYNLVRVTHLQTRVGFKATLNSELNALRTMHVYNPSESLDLGNVPQHKIGSSKLVFIKKLHSDGTFDKYKCRLVLRCDRWVDFFNNKTYSGTIRSETVRLLLSILAETDYEFQSADVRTAFLYGEVLLIRISICLALLVSLMTICHQLYVSENSYMGYQWLLRCLKNIVIKYYLTWDLEQLYQTQDYI